MIPSLDTKLSRKSSTIFTFYNRFNLKAISMCSISIFLLNVDLRNCIADSVPDSLLLGSMSFWACRWVLMMKQIIFAITLLFKNRFMKMELWTWIFMLGDSMDRNLSSWYCFCLDDWVKWKNYLTLFESSSVKLIFRMIVFELSICSCSSTFYLLNFWIKFAMSPKSNALSIADTIRVNRK